MKQNKLMSVSVVALALSACGLGDKNDDALGLETRMKQAVECMQVHSAGVQTGLGPLAVAKGGSDAEEIIKGMREMAKDLPDDNARLPETYMAVADLLSGISGKGIKAAAALAESPGYIDKTQKFAAWHAANCQAVEKA